MAKTWRNCGVLPCAVSSGGGRAQRRLVYLIDALRDVQHSFFISHHPAIVPLSTTSEHFPRRPGGQKLPQKIEEMREFLHLLLCGLIGS
jgi:hypothetical protein